jgi:hypothetical protein
MRNHPTGRCCTVCGALLATDNHGHLCALCLRRSHDPSVGPPPVPPGFWHVDHMTAALTSRHMGKVLAAYRTHPFHRRAISQTVAGHWVDKSQSEISRMEVGPPIKDLDRLAEWARVLHIPRDLLWFKLPEDPSLPGEGAATVADHADDQRTAGGTEPGTTGPSPHLEELHELVDILDDARHLDSASVDLLERQLASCARTDGLAGPRQALPQLLGLVTAIERQARDAPMAVRRDLIRLGARGAELVGWLYRDLGSISGASHWRDRAFEWAAEANDLPMCGYVLLRKSQAAWDQRDARKMLALAHAAADGPWNLPSAVQAEAAQQQARGHAMLGSHPDVVETHIDRAWALLPQTRSGAADQGEALPTLGANYNKALLNLQTAICRTEAGQPDSAITTFQELLASPTLSVRDHGYFLSLLAHAYQQAGEPREAALTGIESVGIAHPLASERTLAELRRLRSGLSEWSDLPEVRDLTAALTAA